MAPVQNHRCEGTDLDADLGTVVETGERGDGAALWDRQSHAGAIVRLGDLQTAVGLGLWIGNRVENDVAISAKNLRRDDDPLSRQGHSEFRCQRPAEFDLKPWRITGLAGEG